MLISHPSTNLIVTLPDGKFGPFKITAQEGQMVQIFDNRHRLVTTIKKAGGSATFNLKFPKWWQFWKSPRWVCDEQS